MNNKHQELIAKQVEVKTYYDRETKEVTKVTHNGVSVSFEQEGNLISLHNHVKHTFNGYGGVLGFTEHDLHDLVDKALDKTPPNKV